MSSFYCKNVMKGLTGRQNNSKSQLANLCAALSTSFPQLKIYLYFEGYLCATGVLIAERITKIIKNGTKDLLQNKRLLQSKVHF